MCGGKELWFHNVELMHLHIYDVINKLWDICTRKKMSFDKRSDSAIVLAGFLFQ